MWIAVCLISAVICASLLNAQSDSLHPTSQDYAGTVSLIRLTANSEKYDGKRAGATGFLRLEFEGNRLYLHQDDYTYNMSENAVRVGLTKSQSKELADNTVHYVFVVGTFKAGIEGTSDPNGSIVNITAVV